MGPATRALTGRVVVIGITGPSASGKTTLAHELARNLGDCVHLQQDYFFRDPDDYPPDANFCDHRWLHLDQFIAAFHALAAGRPALVPDLDFTSFRARGQTALQPARHLIVEGMTILRIPDIYNRCDQRIYLDTDFATITARKRVRDRQERRKPDHVIDAQLAWMRDEHHADLNLRRDPRVLVVGDVRT